MFQIAMKKAAEEAYKKATQGGTEPDEQEGGKKRKKSKTKKKKGGDEDYDVIRIMKNALIDGGNKKEQTFLENKSNYVFIALGMLILFNLYKKNN
tara:strand:- start:36 stop:320 length:285 start_codon:yes stop_codon:yes gene_type:complete